MKVKIFKPTKSAMQSGKAKNKWLLCLNEENNSRSINELMGWVSSNDTKTQLQFEFENKEAAIDFAIAKKFEYEVVEPEIPNIKPKSYAANFTG
jgi:hypothetical protein